MLGTRRRLAPLLLVLLAAAGCRHAPAAGPGERTRAVAFSNVSVVKPEADTVVAGQTVIARDGRIVAVGPASTTAIPPDALVVDGTGRFLLAGLHDLHVHHFGTRNRHRGYTDPDLALYLAAGVTTVRVMHGSEDALRARERIRAGRLAGPRLVVCSEQISGRWHGGTPDSAAAAVRRFHAEGYDCVKLYSGLTSEAFDAAVSTADGLGLPTAGHAPVRLRFEEILRLGSIEHVEEIQWHFGRRPLDSAADTARVDSMVMAGVAVVPTIGGFDFSAYADDDRYAALLARESTAYVPERMLADRDENLAFHRGRGADVDSLAREWRAMYERALQYTRFLHERGVTIVMGTDAGGALTVPGFSAAIELETMVDAGLSPAEALRAATSGAAGFLGSDAGRVEVGRLADLVLLRADPLRSISAVREVEGVLAGGAWLDRAALDALLAELRRR